MHKFTAMPHVALTGRAALVTGGATRVGAAIAHAVAAAGADLLVHYATNTAGARAVVDDAARLGRRAATVRADLTDRAGIELLTQEALAWSGGRLGLLVHNAANFERADPWDLLAEQWDRAMALNAAAPYLLTAALAPALRADSGSIVAIACLSAERPFREHIPYSASKAALVNLVRGLALGLAPDVRANAIAPGAVLLPDGTDEAVRAQAAAKIPLQRIGTAEDVARAVVFLAENDFINGQVLAIDGAASLA